MHLDVPESSVREEMVMASPNRVKPNDANPLVMLQSGIPYVSGSGESMQLSLLGYKSAVASEKRGYSQEDMLSLGSSTRHWQQVEAAVSSSIDVPIVRARRNFTSLEEKLDARRANSIHPGWLRARIQNGYELSGRVRRQRSHSQFQFSFLIQILRTETLAGVPSSSIPILPDWLLDEAGSSSI